jgi:cyclic lactone autoinducer peptide
MGNFDFYKVLAVVAVLAAQFGAGSASLAGCCQPKEPNNIDVVLNKHN